MPEQHCQGRSRESPGVDVMHEPCISLVVDWWIQTSALRWTGWLAAPQWAPPSLEMLRGLMQLVILCMCWGL